jgi:YD repeat-containing protein
MLYKFFLFFNFCLTFSKIIFGQTPTSLTKDPNNINLIPVSPNAASLGKYGDMPVSKYTGIPSITIPLYDVNSGQLKLPVILSYHAGGIKVEELASWVGLGWSLQAGGVISRVTRGIPDGETVPNYSTNVRDLDDPNNTNKEDLKRQITNGLLDSEADIFMYSFGGTSGSFFIGEDGIQCYTMPHQSIDIKMEDNMNRWIITDAAGVKYVFGKSLDGINTAIEINSQSNAVINAINQAAGPQTTNYTKNSWYLLEIVSPEQDKIQFQYEKYTSSFSNLAVLTSRITDMDYGNDAIPQGGAAPNNPMGCASCTNSTSTSTSYSLNVLYAYRLSKIYFKNGRIDFTTYSKYRADVYGEKALDKIDIYNTINGANNFIKGYKFFYSYFISNSAVAPIEYVNVTGNEGYNVSAFSKYRLKLDSLQEFGQQSMTLPAYKFSYNTNYNLPDRNNYTFTPSAYVGLVDGHGDIFGQDNWGYFNGKTSNKTLIPTYLKFGGRTGNSSLFPGGDRNSIEQYAQTAILTGITYPTGGQTKFDYESNTIPSSKLLHTSPTPYGVFASKASTFTLDDLSAFPGAGTEYIGSFTINSLYKLSNTNNTQGTNIHIGGFEAGYIIRYNGSGLIDGCQDSPSQNYSLYNTWTFTNTTTGQQWVDVLGDLFFPNGQYTLRLTRRGTRSCKSVFNLNISFKEYNIPNYSGSAKNTWVGGLRIKSIIDYDGINHVNDKIRRFYYNTFNDNSLSSGTLVSDPIYGWEGFLEKHSCSVHNASGQNGTWSYTCPLSILHSVSQYPLSATQGSIVGYSNVREELSSVNSILRTDYVFDEMRDSRNNYYFPFAPPTSLEWQRGNPLIIDKKSNNGSTFSSTEKTSNLYSVDQIHSLSLNNYKIGISSINVDFPSIEFATVRYPVITQWHHLNSSTVTLLDQQDPSKFLNTISNYQYSPSNLLPSVVSSTNSKGATLKSEMKYPYDFAGTIVYDNMISKKIINPLVEQKNYNNTTLLSQVKTNYNLWNTEKLAKPQTNQKGISAYPLETELTYNSYDNKGNLLQYTAKDGITTCYLWGYNQTYSIAKITGATYADLLTVLGQTDPNLPAIQVLEGTALVNTLTLLRNGLKTSKPLAQVFTYTYAPLVGITNETDPNNKNTFYEYDELNRLKYIRDQDNNIIKKFCYNYAGQVENCAN